MFVFCAKICCGVMYEKESNPQNHTLLKQSKEGRGGGDEVLSCEYVQGGVVDRSGEKREMKGMH